MTQPMFYPELTKAMVTTLSAWQELIATHTNYLDNENCPYTFEQIELLKRIFVNQSDVDRKVEELEDELYDDDDQPDLEQESIRLFKDMKAFKTTIPKSDTTEMATTFRTLVSLMEKIIDLQERSRGLKHFTEFRSLIFDTLDRYLTPQQIAEFLEEVKTKLQIDE